MLCMAAVISGFLKKPLIYGRKGVILCIYMELIACSFISKIYSFSYN